MGGFGSTRWGGHRRRATVDKAGRLGAAALPVRALARALGASDATAGTLDAPGLDTPAGLAWQLDPLAEAADRPGPAARRFALYAELAHAARAARSHPGVGPAAAPLAMAALVPVAQTVRGVRRRPGAGVRWWWRCPGCGHRRATLYVVRVAGAPAGSAGPSPRALRCRACLGLAYTAQRLAPYDRATLAAEKAARRLGADYFGGDGPNGWAPRPKGMRRATYARHLAALQAADERRDTLFLDATTRFLDRVSPGWRTRPYRDW